jgi:hypothetical protein
MSLPVRPPTFSGHPDKIRQWGVFVGGLLVAFLCGLLLMAWVNRQAVRDRAVSAESIEQIELREQIASALVETYRGNYERARQTMSQVFTRVDATSHSGSLRPEAGAEPLLTLLKDRDTIITLLARNEPSAGDAIYRVYTALRTTETNPKKERHNQ